MWTADPREWIDYDTFRELSPIILEQAGLWNHPDSGMSKSEVALWMIANLHQESRLERMSVFPGTHETVGWLKDTVGDMSVLLSFWPFHANPSLGSANFRPSVVDEMLDVELRLPMPGSTEEIISDDQLDANQLDVLNPLRAEWQNFSPADHHHRVWFLFDNEKAIKLLGMNFYRGVERLTRQNLQPTMFTMFAWQSQGVPEHSTLSSSMNSNAVHAREHAVPALLYLNAMVHNEESFGMKIDSEEWNTLQVFEDDDLPAFFQHLGWVDD